MTPAERIRASPGFGVQRTAHILHSCVREALREAKAEISPEEASVLMMLCHQPEPLRIGELAAVMLRDATTVTRQLDGLCRRGLAQRQQDLTDGRVLLASVTEAGRVEFERMQPSLAAIRDRAMRGITDEERDTLVSTLRKMRMNLGSAD